MKATITIIFDQQHAALVAAKMQQWSEFLQTAGMDATFTITTDDPPAADLWQALNGEEKADEQS